MKLQVVQTSRTPSGSVYTTELHAMVATRGTTLGVIMRVSAAVLLSAVFATSAGAADIYRSSFKDTPVPVLVVQTWAGFYFGGNVGYGWSANSGQWRDDTTAREIIEEIPLSTDYHTSLRGPSPSGVFGGGQIGYNLQQGAWVYGLEADIQGADINDSKGYGVTVGETELSGSTRQKVDWFGTVRGRVGYSNGPALFYATGGLAYGNVKDELKINDISDQGPYLHFSKEEVQTGFAVGGGIEYLFSPSWSVKAEYLYIDLGSQKVGGSYVSGPVTYSGSTQEIDASFHTVKVGFNYHVNYGYEPLK